MGNPQVSPQKKKQGPTETDFLAELIQAAALPQQATSNSVQALPEGSAGLPQKAGQDQSSSSNVSLRNLTPNSPLNLANPSLGAMSPTSGQSGDSTLSLNQPQVRAFTPTAGESLAVTKKGRDRGPSSLDLIQSNSNLASDPRLNFAQTPQLQLQPQVGAKSPQTLQNATSSFEKEFITNGAPQNAQQMTAPFAASQMMPFLMSGQPSHLTSLNSSRSGQAGQSDLMSEIQDGFENLILDSPFASDVSSSSPIQGKQLNHKLSGTEFIETLNGTQRASTQQKTLVGGTGKEASRLAGLNIPIEISSDPKAAKTLGMVMGNHEKKPSGKEKINSELFAGIAKDLSSENQFGISNPVPAPMTAHVTSGGQVKDRFATDSLINISSQIKTLSQAGGGEFRVRLKPENLGELNIRVIAKGGNIGVQFQASDEKARKVLEDSMNYLKESRSAQKLSLGSVEVSVMPQSQGSDSNSNQNFMAQQDSFQQNLNQGRNQGNSQRWDQAMQDGMSESKWSAKPRAMSQPFQSRAADLGRIDVTA